MGGLRGGYVVNVVNVVREESMGKYLDLIRSAEKTHEQTGQEKNLLQGHSSVEASIALVPGARINWQLDGGTLRGPATVDFLHTDPDDTRWAFVTTESGWVAVNTKFISHIEEGAQYGDEAA